MLTYTLHRRHTLRLSDINTDAICIYRGNEAAIDPLWNTSSTWSYLRDDREYLEDLARMNSVKPNDLCLSKKFVDGIFSPCSLKHTFSI
jgi:hypothetical protein